MSKDQGALRAFVARGGVWVLVQIPLLVLAYVVPRHFGRALPLEQLDAAGGFGFVLMAAGILLFSAGLYALGPSLTPFPRPRPDATLRTAGIYALVRHPIYSGILFTAVGWSLVLHSLAGLLFDVVLLVFFDRKAAREERWLIAAHPGYTHYRQRVKKLIPWLY